MKKQVYEYDYKFDWILRKQRHKEIGAGSEDYKKKLMEKLEDPAKRKKKKSREEEEDHL